MRRTLSVLYTPAAQPSPETWGAVEEVAEAWSQRHPDQPFIRMQGVLAKLMLPDADAPVAHEWRVVQAALARVHGAVALESSETVWESAEIAAAPFAWLQGVGLPADFVPDPDAALGPPEPCGVCGWVDAFSRPQRADFQVREEALDQATADGAPPAGGWPVVNLPGGRLAMSPAALSAVGSGLETRPVLRADGMASERLVQVTATVRAPPQPCPEHTPHEPEASVCVCGTVHGGQVFAPWAYERAALVGVRVFSRHPSGASLLLFDRAARAALAELGPVHVGEPIVLCDHGEGPAG